MSGITPPDDTPHDLPGGPTPARVVAKVVGQVELFTLDATDAPVADLADGAGPDAGLSDVERHMLDFERHAWIRPGAKEQRIRELFGVTPGVYFMRLNRLLNRRDALEYAPTVVNRLRRVRESRAHAS